MVESMDRRRISIRLRDNLRSLPFFIFCICGVLGVLLDSDHVLYGGRQFHGIALVLACCGVIIGLVGALSGRYMGRILRCR
jgi:hypothetical protein